MNSRAAALRPKLERAIKTGVLDGEKLVCEHEGDNCDGDLRHYLWYDIFSDNPKGILTLCDRHDGYYGNPEEGYFYCDSCGKTFIENYTWEYYRAHDEDGNTLCLPCYAKQEIADEGNWIDLETTDLDADIRKAKHLIGVEMPVPKGIKFVNNVEFDSGSGKAISGGGVEELRETLQELRRKGYKRAMFILDAAYQFAVSIGVYVDADAKLSKAS